MSRPTSSAFSLAWAVPILAEAAALGRSIALAWLIGPEELGRAMMLALTVRLVEMGSDVGIDRLIVQAPDGNSNRLQSGLHGASFLRGLFSCIMVLSLASFLAIVFTDGPSSLSYSALAVIPLIRGFAHLDFRRGERRFKYLKMSVVECGATIAMLLSTLPAVWFFGDHRAMAVVLIAHAATYTVLSHIVAKRRYSLRFCRATLERTWTFGAPLILNALLLFMTFYADRLIVARAYDWTYLALYGVALQMALLPAQIVGRAAVSLVLPMLREALSNGEFDAIWARILTTHALLAGGMVIGFAVIAPPIIALIYGAEFRPDGMLALALAFAAGFRILRTPFSQLAFATGRTADPARANIYRALALIPAVVFAVFGLPLAAIAAAAALGEAGATLRAYYLSATNVGRSDINEALA